MAIPVYLWIKNDKGNDIRGSVDLNQREGSIEVTSLFHNIHIPTDIFAGNVTGTVIHEPVGIIKEIDSSSPYLFKALATGETLKTAELKFYRINDAGQEVEYFNIFLEYVKVISIIPIMYDIKDAAYERKNHLEALELMYEKITWTYKDGNIKHSDSWKDRKTA